MSKRCEELEDRLVRACKTAAYWRRHIELTSAELTQDDKRGRQKLIRSQIPLRQMSESRYLAIYNCTTKSPSVAKIWESLPDFARVLFDREYKANSKHMQETRLLRATLVSLWTGDKQRDCERLIFKEVQAAILTDSADLLCQWMTFIRALNFNLLSKCEWPHQVTVWRKSDMDHQQARAYRAGDSFRICMFASTSRCKRVVKDLRRNDGEYLWKFIIPVGCMQACDVCSDCFSSKKRKCCLSHTRSYVHSIDN